MIPVNSIEVNFDRLRWETLKEVYVNDRQTEIYFITKDGTKFLMTHEQECCEHVWVEEIIGDLGVLINSEILKAEVATNRDLDKLDSDDDSFIWTFYTLATIKGYVTFRWYGESNGCYSETVKLYYCGKDNA